MEKLHKGAKWLFRLQSYVVFLAIFLFGLFTFIINLAEKGLSFKPFLLFLAIFLCFIILAEIFVHWAYRNWKYEFTQHSLKIEKGVIIKKYKSIPYERIQNVDITRGIIARMIGFSTIDIQTAGYSAYSSYGGKGHSEGHIPAVSIEHAEKIREFLIKRISHNKQGL
ncbi:MAG: PH domain-containing protein [Candidatus Diapherotrites archaeon]